MSLNQKQSLAFPMPKKIYAMSEVNQFLKYRNYRDNFYEIDIKRYPDHLLQKLVGFQKWESSDQSVEIDKVIFEGNKARKIDKTCNTLFRVHDSSG